MVLCALLICIGRGFSHAAETLPVFKINEGASIVLHGNADNASAYQWYRNGIKINGAVTKDYKASQAGIYTVMAFNGEGCPSQLSEGVQVEVITTSVPPVNPVDTVVDLAVDIKSTNTKAVPGNNYDYILTAADNSRISGTHVQVTYVLPSMIKYIAGLADNGIVSYDPAKRMLTWNIPQLAKDAPVNLTVTVTVLDAGAITSIVNIKGREHDPILVNNVAQVTQQVDPLGVPNVFTPNGDGVNDTFFIPGLDTYTEDEIVIINRWGNNVYEKKNYQGDWTGNGLPEGTYFYVLKVKTLAGIWKVYKGYVTLLRTKM